MPAIFSVEVLRDCVMVGEDSSEVVKVVVAYILDAEIISNEYKHCSRFDYNPTLTQISMSMFTNVDTLSLIKVRCCGLEVW